MCHRFSIPAISKSHSPGTRIKDIDNISKVVCSGTVMDILLDPREEVVAKQLLMVNPSYLIMVG